MNTDTEFAIAGFSAAVDAALDAKVVWAAWGAATDGKAFDRNIQAAIAAREAVGLIGLATRQQG